MATWVLWLVAMAVITASALVIAWTIHVRRRAQDDEIAVARFEWYSKDESPKR